MASTTEALSSAQWGRVGMLALMNEEHGRKMMEFVVWKRSTGSDSRTHRGADVCRAGVG